MDSWTSFRIKIAVHSGFFFATNKKSYEPPENTKTALTTTSLIFQCSSVQHTFIYLKMEL